MSPAQKTTAPCLQEQLQPHLTAIAHVLVAVAPVSLAGEAAPSFCVTRGVCVLHFEARGLAGDARVASPAAAELWLGLVAGGHGCQGTALVLLSKTAEACEVVGKVQWQLAVTQLQHA
jgi:hypothetical protein